MSIAEIQKRCLAIIEGLRQCAQMDASQARGHLYRSAAYSIAAVLAFITPGTVVSIPPLPSHNTADPAALLKIVSVGQTLLQPLRAHDTLSQTRSLCYDTALISVRAAIQNFITPEDAATS